jgi:hypothetical protein
MKAAAMALSSAARRGRCSSMSEKVSWKLRVHARAYTMMPRNHIRCKRTLCSEAWSRVLDLVKVHGLCLQRMADETRDVSSERMTAKKRERERMHPRGLRT